VREPTSFRHAEFRRAKVRKFVGEISGNFQDSCRVL
jgi:hypothetical protein